MVMSHGKVTLPRVRAWGFERLPWESPGALTDSKLSAVQPTTTIEPATRLDMRKLTDAVTPGRAPASSARWVALTVPPPPNPAAPGG